MPITEIRRRQPQPARPADRISPWRPILTHRHRRPPVLIRRPALRIVRHPTPRLRRRDPAMHGQQLPGAWKQPVNRLFGSARRLWNTGRDFCLTVRRYGCNAQLRYGCDAELRCEYNSQLRWQRHQLRHRHDAQLRCEHDAQLRCGHDAQLRCGPTPSYGTGTTPGYGSGTAPAYGAPSAGSSTGIAPPTGTTSLNSNSARPASSTASDDRYGERPLRFGLHYRSFVIPPRPDRLPTLGDPLPPVREAACRRAAILLIRPPPVRLITSRPPPVRHRMPQAPIRPPVRLLPVPTPPIRRPIAQAACGPRAISLRGTSAACRRRHRAAVPTVREWFPPATRKPPISATDRLEQRN